MGDERQTNRLYALVWYAFCNIDSVTKKQYIMTTQDTIITLFNNLTNEEKVETLTSLYFSLRAEQKDDFLRETENA